MIYANVFGKVTGIFFVVILIIAVCFYTFVVVKSLVDKIKRNKKIKNDEKRLKNEPKRKEDVNKN